MKLEEATNLTFITALRTLKPQTVLWKHPESMRENQHLLNITWSSCSDFFSGIFSSDMHSVKKSPSVGQGDLKHISNLFLLAVQNSGSKKQVFPF